MKKEYIMPFVEATQNVFQEFFGVTPQLDTPYFVKKEETSNWDISGIIGIAGELKGIIVLSISEKVAISLTSTLLERKITTLDDEVIDTIAEVANIIAGNSKKGFEEVRLKISLPAIVKGKEHEIFWPKQDIPILSIPFTVPVGKFVLYVGLEKKITTDILL
ncbi:MAG: chemotaxis protein CheX [Spirochaetes bacterium]|nr:chemotaxis protein CheX [Spirochaetota bacterium]